MSLSQLSQAWQNVVARSYLLKALGNIVNEVLTVILKDIEDMVDISADESDRLNLLCKSLHELENLFSDGTRVMQSEVGIHVPIWFKFVFLSEILSASMADLMYLWNEGHLHEFSAQEIVNLITALFSDSSARQKNINAILGHH
ncbi:hypothetical protein BT69DRAFT_1364442 [Atractiella rhizophila]|nr:hypothetical protein BT69DRAFT_1364442 [Atractiella rhizophila]